jgi:hypothetical protein
MTGAWRESCDVLLRIPMVGSASSLNAATAGSVVLYEAMQRRAGGGGGGGNRLQLSGNFQVAAPYGVKFSTGTPDIPTRPADKAATLTVWVPPLRRTVPLVAAVRLPSVALRV